MKKMLLFLCLSGAVLFLLNWTPPNAVTISASSAQIKSNTAPQSVNKIVSAKVEIPTTTKEEPSSSERAQWLDYTQDKLTYAQLSEANKKRADQKKRLQYEAKDKERREKLQAYDQAEGRNAEIREREADLKSRSESLYQGMTQARLLEVMGSPSKWGQSTWAGTGKDIPPEFKVPNTTKTYVQTIWHDPSELKNLPFIGPKSVRTLFVYSPHSSGKTHYNMGDSFQYLEVWCSNETGTILEWHWLPPFVSF